MSSAGEQPFGADAAAALENVLADVSGTRLATRYRDYSRLVFEFRGQAYACVPLQKREGGILLALPSGTIDQGVFDEASVGGFLGALGPYHVGTCRLVSPAGRAQGSPVGVLVLDLSFAPDDAVREEWATEGISLTDLYDDDATDVVGFGAPSQSGETRWLHSSGTRALVDGFLASAVDGGARQSDYVTADDGQASLRATRRPARPKAEASAKAQALGLNALTGRGWGPLAGAPIAGKVASPAANTQLFGEEAGRAGLDAAQLQALLKAAGRGGLASSSIAGKSSATIAQRRAAPPPRGRQNTGSRVWQTENELAEEDLGDEGDDDLEDPEDSGRIPGRAAEAAAEAAAAALIGMDNTSGLGPILAALMLQNQTMMQAIAPKTRSDPLRCLLEAGAGTGGDGDGPRGTGLKGCAARSAWVKSIREQGPAILDSIRSRLADVSEVDVEGLVPASMRAFFEKKVPLGHQKGLTYFAMLAAKMWEHHERGDHSAAHVLSGLACVYLEQVAVDQGRHQVGWLLTGLPQPAFNLTQQNQSRNQEEPFGLLGDPLWLAANLSYLKDLDYFDARQKSTSTSRGGKDPPSGPPTGPSRPRPKGPRKPKAPPSAKEQ